MTAPLSEHIAYKIIDGRGAKCEAPFPIEFSRAQGNKKVRHILSAVRFWSLLIPLDLAGNAIDGSRNRPEFGLLPKTREALAFSIKCNQGDHFMCDN